MAEATLAVAFPQPSCPVRFDRVDRGRLAADGIAVPRTADDADSVTFVSVGHALPGHCIDIVGRGTDESLPERQVGELVVEGASVTPRYFGDATEVRRRRLYTGDLAYIADGHVYVVDRIKDLVIIAGQSYAPSDIETAAASTSGLRRGRIVAFSSAGSAGTERLHIVAEASAQGWRPPSEIEDDVRRRIRRDIGLSVASVTIVAPGSLERTSSGKVRRRACVEAHRQGTLKIVRSQLDLRAYQWARRRLLLRSEIVRAAGAVRGWIAMLLASPRTDVGDR